MRRLLFLVLCVVLVAGAAVGAAWRWYERPLAALTTPLTVEVPPGATVGAVAHALARAGIPIEPRLWSALTRASGRARRLRAGEYLIPAGASPVQIADQLVQGRVLLHPITLVEGWTVAEALAAVRSSDVLRHDLQPEAGTAHLMAALGEADEPAEGQLFPDTYLVPRGSSDLDLLRQAHARLRSVLAAAWAGRDAGLPLADPYAALTLASIIEKETAAPEERAEVAAVFVNRLRRDMRLQTDPTVIYGLGPAYQGTLHRVDLTTDTPYNTYTRTGLPPTPIALPGRASIEAAVHPADSAALYFVALGDGSGRHVFSTSLEAHDAAVARYVARLRAQGRGGAP